MKMMISTRKNALSKKLYLLKNRTGACSFKNSCKAPKKKKKLIQITVITAAFVQLRKKNQEKTLMAMVRNTYDTQSRAASFTLMKPKFSRKPCSTKNTGNSTR